MPAPHCHPSQPAQVPVQLLVWVPCTATPPHSTQPTGSLRKTGLACPHLPEALLRTLPVWSSPPHTALAHCPHPAQSQTILHPLTHAQPGLVPSRHVQAPGPPHPRQHHWCKVLPGPSYGSSSRAPHVHSPPVPGDARPVGELRWASRGLKTVSPMWLPKLEAVVGQSVPSCCVPLTAREGQGGGHQY